MKKIIFCADGTWDEPGKNTNVYKIFKALSITANQIPYYDDGVGSNGLLIQKLTGGAFGCGLFQKIKNAYTKIAHVYEEGDEIFLFGFSRGAYTARSLAGMIALCGLPTHDFTDDLIEKAFNAYRGKDRRSELLTELNRTCDLFNAKINMIGVWDTVGSLGIPAIFGGISPGVYGFLDTKLHPNVLNAYHSLALDERRAEFPATLWDAAAPHQTLEQVWFSGVHCDVGGSYPADSDGSALSDITLAWMIGKAAACGLQFDPEAVQRLALPMEAKFALDTKHESWSVAWLFPRPRVVPPGAVLSDSVVVRTLHDATYQPGNLTFMDGRLSSQYRTVPIVSAPTLGAAV